MVLRQATAHVESRTLTVNAATSTKMLTTACQTTFVANQTFSMMAAVTSFGPGSKLLDTNSANRHE